MLHLNQVKVLCLVVNVFVCFDLYHCVYDNKADANSDAKQTKNDVFEHRGQNVSEKLNFAKGYGAVRLINEFPAKGWKKNTLNDFVKRLKQTGSITRKSGSDRPRTARTATNIDAVDELVLSLKQSDWACMCVKEHHFEHLL